MTWNNTLTVQQLILLLFW